MSPHSANPRFEVRIIAPFPFLALTSPASSVSSSLSGRAAGNGEDEKGNDIHAPSIATSLN